MRAFAVGLASAVRYQLRVSHPGKAGMPQLRGSTPRRTSNNSATAALLALCISALTEVAAADAAASDRAAEQQYSCQAISKVPQPQRCHFVTSECESHSRIPFLEFYYCSVEPAGMLAKLPFVLLLCALLPLLFTLLGDTAEIYFSPTMAVVAQSIPKMRPRFAGVTFVAMGNGAADLSANISAIRNGSVQLSAGAFTGAAMFVQCVVASEVIRISRGTPCRGATLRDVATYAISIIGVALSFASGRITQWFVAGALLVYALYAAWVFGGDEWHERGRPRPTLSWSQLLEIMRQRSRAGADSAPQWASFEAAEPLLPAGSMSSLEPVARPLAATGTGSGQQPAHHPPGTSHGHSHGHGQGHSRAAHLVDADTYRQAVWADLSSDPGLMAAIRTGRAARAHGAHDGERGVSLEMQAGFSGAGAGESWPSPAASLPQSPLRENANGYTGIEQSSRFRPSPQEQEQRGPLQTRQLQAGDLESYGSGEVLGVASGHGKWKGGMEAEAPSGMTGRPTGSAVAPMATPAAVPWGQNHGASPPEAAWQGQAAAAAWDEMRAARGAEASPAHQDDGPGRHDEHQAVGLWQQVCIELTVGEAREWPHLRPLRRHFRATTFPLLLPIYAALRTTIPLIDPAVYSQQWLVVTMLCAPLATVAYLELLQPWPVGVALVAGGMLAAGVHLVTKDEEELPALDLGTRFAFGPAVFSLMGFFMGVLWIDTFASEVVAILSLLASLASLPSSLMGLTLLAWGSSLGDFFGNAALARRGHASTALTACFAGPLFNMLVSLALGFSANFASHGISSMQVSLPPDVTLGVITLVIYNVLVAVVGLSNGFRLPERFYLFARSWYALYLMLACGLGLAEMIRSA